MKKIEIKENLNISNNKMLMMTPTSIFFPVIFKKVVNLFSFLIFFMVSSFSLHFWFFFLFIYFFLFCFALPFRTKKRWVNIAFVRVMQFIALQLLAILLCCGILWWKEVFCSIPFKFSRFYLKISD